MSWRNADRWGPNALASMSAGTCNLVNLAATKFALRFGDPPTVLIAVGTQLQKKTTRENECEPLGSASFAELSGTPKKRSQPLLAEAYA